MSRKPLSKEEFEYFFKKMPRITVEVVLIHKGGVVLTKRDIPPDKGYWHIPGGSVLKGETLEDAVHEVAKDELGVEVSIIRFLKFFYYPRLLEESGYWPIGAGFLTKLKSGKISVGEDSSDVQVFTQIPEKVVHDQKDFLLELFKNNLEV